MQDLKALNLKLGKDVAEADQLDAVPRSIGRQNLGPDLPIFGYDLWNAYEVSFLKPGGMPTCLHMQACYPASSPNLVESKSFKLFLNARNNTEYPGLPQFAGFVKERLSKCVGAPANLDFMGPDRHPMFHSPQGLCLDNEDIPCIATCPSPELILPQPSPSGRFDFYSHLFRSCCPITSQPDWGTVVITLDGHLEPQPASLLRYLVAFRNKADFHESCCEQIYADLYFRLQPRRLKVSCHYTRRGGLDINPVRASFPLEPEKLALLWRQ